MMKYLCLAVGLAIVLQVFPDVHADNKTEVHADKQTKVHADNQSGLEIRAKKPKKCKPGKCCTAGWYKFGTKCYKYFAAPLNWEDAELVCERRNSWLTSVHSAAENTFVANLQGNSAWIGGFRKPNDLTPFWAWIDGSSLDYTNWNVGEPNDGYGAEDCVEIKDTGKWNDIRCTNIKPYVCEKPI
eukprot:GFUD01059185.1.p1 GENE.GFUD01059185.1~~GFUD01059185.1.p1  ORF type:complete len:185 (-),score=27.51 GFUD01059185.1:286-840(-)